MIKQIVCVSALFLHSFSHAAEIVARPASTELVFSAPIFELIAHYRGVETHLSMPPQRTPFNPITLSHDGTEILTSVIKPIASDMVVRKKQKKIHCIFLKNLSDDTARVKYLHQTPEKPVALAYKDGALYVMNCHGDIKRHAEDPRVAFYPDHVGTHPGIDETKDCGLRMEEQKLVSYGAGKRCAWDLTWEPHAEVSECEQNLYHQNDGINTAQIRVRQYVPRNSRHYSLLVSRYAELINAIREGLQGQA